MSNKFKVGDKFTVKQLDSCTRDCTLGKAYTAIHVGRGHGQFGGESDDDVQFIDDVGDKVIQWYFNLNPA